MKLPTITWNIPGDIAYQGLTGGLMCGAMFLTTVVLLEWFWG
jgi:hypothetical protein